MFAYVEFLRALRAMRIVAILLGLLLLAALIARLSWGTLGMNQAQSVAGLEHSPTAHVTRTALPNGVTRTVIDDPKQGVHAVVERRGGEITSFTMRGSEPRDGAARNHERVHTTIDAEMQAGGSISTSGMAFSFFELSSLFSMAVPMGFLVATLLAGPLSKENNGHLEVAWTKPVSRDAYALSAMLVDVTAVAVAQVAMVAALLIAACFWEAPKLSFAAGAPARLAFALMAPIAWYACLTAFSASMKRGPGAVLGIGWVAAVVCPWIAGSMQHTATPVGRSVHAFFTTASYLDPIAYAWFPVYDAVSDPVRVTNNALLALAILTILYGALAVLQWRRVEA